MVDGQLYLNISEAAHKTLVLTLVQEFIACLRAT